MSPSAAPSLLLLLRPPLKAQPPAAAPTARTPGDPLSPSEGEANRPPYTGRVLGDVSPQRSPGSPLNLSPQTAAGGGERGEVGNGPPVAPHWGGGQPQYGAIATMLGSPALSSAWRSSPKGTGSHRDGGGCQAGGLAGESVRCRRNPNPIERVRAPQPVPL